MTLDPFADLAPLECLPRIQPPFTCLHILISVSQVEESWRRVDELTQARDQAESDLATTKATLASTAAAYEQQLADLTKDRNEARQALANGVATATAVATTNLEESRKQVSTEPGFKVFLIPRA